MNIPKAEEFYSKKDVNGLPMSFNEKMIEFAKLHVEAALKKASQNAKIINDLDANKKRISKNSILNAYPLTNIK